MTEILWLYDLAETQVAAIDNPNQLEIEEQLQSTETLRFQIPADDPRGDYLGEDRLISWRGRYFRTTEISLVRDGAALRWEVAAEARWIDLMNYLAPTTVPAGSTIKAGLTALLAGTGWTAGTVESDGGSFTIAPVLGDTVLASLRTWATMTAREYEFDTAHQIVNVVVEQGTNRGLGFRYGRNLTSVKRRAEPVIATRLYPIGKDGLTPAEVNPTHKAYVDDFSWYTSQGVPLATAQAKYLKVQTWQDDRYLLALNLYDAGIRRLGGLAVPRISYEATAIDLSTLTGTGEQYLIGDTCRVWDGPAGLQINVRIVRKITHPLEPNTTTVELGYLQGTTPTSTSTSSGGSSTGGFDMLVDTNLNPITVSGLVTLNSIKVAITSGGMANTIFGTNIDATATGTGTVTITYWYGGNKVGPTSQFPFVAGPLNISIPDFLIGLKTDDTFYCKAQVTSGTGTLAIANDAAHLYVAGAGLAQGSTGAADQQVTEAWIYPAATTEAAPVVSLLTPTSLTPAEAWPYPADPTETVIHVP